MTACHVSGPLSLSGGGGLRVGGADVTGERSGLVVIASVVRLCTGDTGISPGSHWKLRSSTFRRVHLGGRYGIVSLLLMLCPWPSGEGSGLGTREAASSN